MSTVEAIQTCITRVMKAKDRRGAAQAERLCVESLAPAGLPVESPSHAIARDCAAAARRVGEWLKVAA